MAADHAKEDSDIAIATARQFAPDFKQPGLERLKSREQFRIKPVPEEQIPVKPIPQQQQNDISNQVPNQVPTNPTVLPQKPTQQLPQHSLYNKKPQDNPQPPQNPNPPSYQQTNQLLNSTPKKLEPPNQNNYSQQNLQQVNHQGLTRSQTSLQKQNLDNRLPNNSIEIPNRGSQTGLNNPGSQLRRNSKPIQGDRPSLAQTQQSSIDHFDHYKRPPSRDSSVDRYSRAASRMGLASRQPSVDKTGMEPDARSVRGSSIARGATPMSTTGNGSVLTGSGVVRYHHRPLLPTSCLIIFLSPQQLCGRTESTAFRGYSLEEEEPWTGYYPFPGSAEENWEPVY